MGLHLVDIYRSPNIGIFLKTNDKLLLAPRGLAPSKGEKLKEALGVSICYTSVAGSRLLGPLVAMNNNGILVSRLAEDVEMREIAAATGMVIGRFNSKYTAVGNLIAANDRFALVSALLDSGTLHQVRDVLGTEVDPDTASERRRPRSPLVDERRREVPTVEVPQQLDQQRASIDHLTGHVVDRDHQTGEFVRHRRRPVAVDADARDHGHTLIGR